MSELSDVLKQHALRYPFMQCQDVVKLVYQNVMGPGHMIKDSKSSLEYIRRECDIVGNDDSALLENIGNGMARLNLRALKSNGLSIEQVNNFFVESSYMIHGTADDLKKALHEVSDIIALIIEQCGLNFTSTDFDEFLKDYEKAGLPMTHHSDLYNKIYKPAYRVISCKVPGMSFYLQKQE